MKATFTCVFFLLMLCSISARSNNVFDLELEKTYNFNVLQGSFQCKADTLIELPRLPVFIEVAALLDSSNVGCTYSFQNNEIVLIKTIDCSFLKGQEQRTEAVWIYEFNTNTNFATDSCIIDITIVNNGICTCDHPDYGGLMDIFYTSNGTSWESNSDWFQGARGVNCDVCNWDGVTCVGNRVTQVELPGNKLSGRLPTPDLSELTFIDFSDNDISGEISDLSYLNNLNLLDLGDNSFSGCFPPFSCSPSLMFNAIGNGRMPWNGDAGQFCNNPMDEIGAPCNINGFAGEIDPNCTCIVKGAIEVQVWLDANANGRQDNGTGCPENGVNGPLFSLIDIKTGNITQDANGNLLDSLPTDANGTLFIDEIFYGNYFLRVDNLGSYVITKVNQDGGANDDFDSEIDSDFDPQNRMTHSFILGSGQTKTNIDLGLYQNLTLGGVVWVQYDNANGTYDGPPDEALVSDIIMNLYKDNDGDGIFESLISTTVTDTEGEYIFSDIAPDTYMVEVDRDNFDAGTQLEVFQCVTDNFLLDGSPLSNDGIGPNGTANGGAEASPVLLRSGCEPSGNENITVDFGFFTGFDCQASNPDYFAIDCSETDPDSPNYNNFFPFCDLNFLDGFCSTMTPVITGNGPTPLCDNGGIPHNISWFSFVAGHGDYTVEVTPGRCTDSLGNIPGLGIQMGVYNDCSFTEQIGPCVGTPSSQAPVSFSNIDPNTGAVVMFPGETYYVFLDGAQGSVCKYDVEVIGNFVPYLSDCPSGIDCGGDNVDSDCTMAVCPGEEILFTLQDIAIEGIDYMWSVSQPNGWEITSTIPDPANPLETNFNNIEIRFNEDGVYTVCYESITSKCFSNSRINDCGSDPALCKEITVRSFADEDFGTKYLCQWELDAYVGPTEDDNGNPDPNGDGLEGWQTNVNFWSEGVFEYEVVRADGCVYIERVELVNISPASGIIDTILCAADPVNIFGFTFDENIVLDQFNLAPDVFATNGCDSIVDLYIWFMYLEGELTSSGNGNPNYTIDFIENTSATRDADARTVYSYTWYRTAFGVGDGWEQNDGDPDNNPYTFETAECGEWQLHINMTVNDQTSGLPLEGCTYIFTTNIECPTCEAPSDICKETVDIVLETDLDGVIAYECMRGCLENASPETDIDACFTDTNPTVWHTFEVDSNARQVFVNVSTSDGSWSPSFTIFDGSCSNLNLIADCNSGDVLSAGISNGTTKIYVAVSVEDPANIVDPSYTICASALKSGVACLGGSPPDYSPTCETRATFEVMSRSADPDGSKGLSLGGPFCPSETINLCASFDYDATATGQDWLQGIIPYFGNGWDLSQFEPTSISITPEGAEWFEEGTTTFTETMPNLCTYLDADGKLVICNTYCQICPCTAPLPQGSNVPSAWFWTSPGAGPNCDGTSDLPETSFGIPGGSIVNVSFCLDLEIKTFTSEEECLVSNLDFGFQTTSDGVTGCAENPIAACLFDVIQVVNYDIDCGSSPETIELSEGTLELCNNSDFNIDVSISNNFSANVLVEVVPNPNVSGITNSQTIPGGVGTFTQNLSLNTGVNTAQEVIYNFSVAGGQGCSGVLGNQLTVTVYPDIEVEFASDLEVCPDSCIVLSPIVSGGTGDYASFEWSTGSVDTNIEVCPSTSSNYTLTVVDDLGCSSITDVNVALNPNVVFTSSNDSLTICQELNGQNENGELIISNFGGTPPYTIVWTTPNGLVGGIASTMISIPGDTYIIDEEASSTSSAPYPLLVQVVDAMGCIARDTILVSILEKTQCDPTSTIDEAFNIKVFPNPTKDWITIHSDQVIKGPIAIYDIYGHQLIETRDIEINVSELPSGIYFLKVEETVVKFYKL